MKVEMRLSRLNIFAICFACNKLSRHLFVFLIKWSIESNQRVRSLIVNRKLFILSLMYCLQVLESIPSSKF